MHLAFAMQNTETVYELLIMGGGGWEEAELSRICCLKT